MVFHFTPRHDPSMNQIEVWVGILAEKVIRRGNFASQADLRSRIMDVIDYFKPTIADSVDRPPIIV
jgi:putative transposase